MEFCCAQNILQLYNQLIRKNYSESQLRIIKKSYELSRQLFAGRFQYSGKEFYCHNVGTASILCFLNQSSEIISAGLLHNAYGNANFDTLKKIESKREFIRKKLGDEIEKYLYSFYSINYNYKRNWRRTYLHSPELVENIGETEKTTLLIQLADMLEHNVNSGILFTNMHQQRLQFIKEKGSSIVSLANKLGYPELAKQLEINFDNTLKEISSTSSVITNQKFSHLIIPKSYTKKTSLKLVEFFNFYTNKLLRKKHIIKTIRPVRKRISDHF